MSDYSIGVDLGGTNLRAAAVTADGAMLEKISGSTDLHEGRDAVIADMVAAVQRLRESCGERRLAGVGIGVPGFILIEKGVISGSNNLPQFDNFPIRDVIEQQLGTS
ncbi:MAG TPA: ROK family protein, partial [Bryobacteraceae bacterium]|nr:ROK family protein [Bryobacteraceae bacterium]